MPPAADPLAALALASPGAHGVLLTFALFVIPTGAGIPAGGLLGQRLGLTATAMSGLYVGSGLLRAVLFEPVFRWLARRRHAVGWVARWRDAGRALLARHARLSRSLSGAWAPLVVGYNLDPMAGRVGGRRGRNGLAARLDSRPARRFRLLPQRGRSHPLAPASGRQRVALTLLLFVVLSTAIPMLWRAARRAIHR